MGPLSAKIAGFAVADAIANDCSAVTKLQFISELERYGGKNDGSQVKRQIAHCVIHIIASNQCA